MKLFALTATEAIDRIKRGKISVTEMVEAYCKRLEAVEPSVHAWSFFDKELVYRQREHIEQELAAGSFDGHFYGVPIGVKDIFNTKDMPTGMGSPIWEGFTPGNDARVVHNARLEGGIIMGKTVTAEFAVHTPGPTLNPHHAGYFPGTSSTGSAVAVATAMVPLALGTQTAGSIVKPASYCGVYGYKPSFGLLPRTGILKTVDPLDHVGFFARSVADVKLMLDALRVKGWNYPQVHAHLENKRRQSKAPKKPWRVALVKTSLWNYAEDYTQKAITRFADKLAKEKDIRVVERTLPDGFQDAAHVHETIYDKALSYYFQGEYTNHYDKISDNFKLMVEKGRKIDKKEYLAALDQQTKLTRKLDTFFGDVDIVITFSTAGEAPRKEDYLDEKPATGLLWTMCRVPSINLPLFTGPAGLPFGAQAVARRYNDYLLLSFLQSLEDRGLLAHAPIALERLSR